MPAYDITATSDSAVDTSWTASTGTKWQAVAADGGGNIFKGGAAGRQGFVFANIPADAIALSDPITLTTKNSWGGAHSTDKVNSYSKDGGVYKDYPNLPDTTGYVTTDQVITLGAGDAQLTPALVNSSEWGCRRTGTNATQCAVDLLHLWGNYATAPGGFAYLIVSLIGGMLGANLMMGDMYGISREVALHPRHGEGISIIQPHEYEQALRELREYHFRTWSL